MQHNSVEPRDQIFVKGYSFWSFVKKIGKNISKSLSYKNSQKPLDYAKQSVTNIVKTGSKKIENSRSNQWFDDFTGNKNVDKVTSTVSQSNLELLYK